MSVNNIDPNVRLASLIRDAHFHIKPTHLTKIDKEGFIDALDAKNLDYDVVEIGGNTANKPKHKRKQRQFQWNSPHLAENCPFRYNIDANNALRKEKIQLCWLANR